MKRKNIGVCVTGYNWEYETRLVDGILRRCRELDINLLAFASLLRRPTLNSSFEMPESTVRGETEIFNLINYKMLDGIIILGDSLIKESLVYNIHDMAEKHGIPVVNVNDPSHVLSHNVYLSEKNAMEYVMRHLVEDHGLTKINFIGGFPGNLQTEERLAAYTKILTEHNIPVEEERIAYGEFWRKAVDCTKEFMSRDEKPEAIVCASDTMAIFAMTWLKENGFRVPEDVVVTGFDGIRDCEMVSPSLTTVRRSFGESGVAAVNIIYNIWEGRQQPENVNVNSALVKNHSCGCEGVNDIDRDDLIKIHNDEKIRILEFNMHHINLTSRFALASTSEELYSSACDGAKFFHLKRLYICICSEIERGVHSFYDDSSDEYNGISDTMISMLKYGHDVPVGTEFPSSQLIPEDIFDGDEPVFLAFSPLYYKNHFLGYAAYEPSMTNGMGDYFPVWLLSIASNAGSFYTKSELEVVVNKLENLNMRDPLTGLFNRRGMQRFGKELLKKAKADNTGIAVVCADIDGLKPINDVYGHEMGDNAIMQTANALSMAFPKDAVCTRTGGDEYCIMFACDDNTFPEECIKTVDSLLDKYNSTSGLPYKVRCSCGCYTLHPGPSDTLDSIMKTADMEMYMRKLKRKKAMKV